MPQSLSALYVHAVFSTKNRKPYLLDRSLREEVQAFIGGATRTLGCPPVAVGGVEDHVHLLVRFSRTASVSDWIKEVKRASSHFAKERVRDFAWQAGYAAFSVDPTSIERVAAYVRGQETHHRKTSFQDELRQLLAEHGVEWDEQYLWD